MSKLYALKKANSCTFVDMRRIVALSLQIIYSMKECAAHYFLIEDIHTANPVAEINPDVNGSIFTMNFKLKLNRYSGGEIGGKHLPNSLMSLME